jgi:hypothetical protein
LQIFLKIFLHIKIIAIFVPSKQHNMYTDINDYWAHIGTELTEKQKYHYLWLRADMKRKLKIKQGAITYNIAGGGIQRDFDIEFAEDVANRIYDYLQNKYKFKTINELCD